MEDKEEITPLSVLLPIFEAIRPLPRLSNREALESELKFLFPDSNASPMEKIPAKSWLTAKLCVQTRGALEAEGVIGEDMKDLASKQLSMVLLAKAMNESLEHASLQSKASLGTLFMGYYAALCARGLAESQASHPTAQEILDRWGPLSEALQQVDNLSIGIFPCIDFITATLSINPTSGELECEGLIKPSASQMADRAALLRKLLRERASSGSEVEFEVLKWMHGDPLLGRSLYDWMLVTATEDDDGRSVHLKWEGASESDKDDKVEKEALCLALIDWAHSLAFLSMTLAVFWISESNRLIVSAGVNMDENGILGNPGLVYQPDLSLETRLTNFAVSMTMDSKLIWLDSKFEGDGDTFHLRLLDVDPDLSKSQRSWECGMCMEIKEESLLVLEPCVHQICEECMRRYLGLARQGDGPAVHCPFCRFGIQNAIRRKKEAWLQTFDALSGSIGVHYVPVLSRLSEMLSAACKATDRAERPPRSLLLVRLSIIEPAGTIGSALVFLSDGLSLAKIVRENGPVGASLNDRVTADGHHQCYNHQCMKMEMKGGPRFNKCASCHSVWYCSKECQKTAWTKGKHKRICNMYKELVERRGALSSAAAAAVKDK